MGKSKINEDQDFVPTKKKSPNRRSPRRKSNASRKPKQSHAPVSSPNQVFTNQDLNNEALNEDFYTPQNANYENGDCAPGFMTHNDKAETYIKSGWMIEDYVKKLGKTPARDPPAMPATGSEAITTLRFETDKSDEQYEMDQAEKKIAEDQNAIHAAIANKENWDAIEKYIEDKEEAQRIEDEKVENQRIEDEAEAQRIEDDGQREIEENQQMDIDQEEEPEMPEKEEEL